MLHNQPHMAKFVTCIDEPGGFLDFYKVEHETGIELAAGLWKIIETTESTNTLLALGSGDNFC